MSVSTLLAGFVSWWFARLRSIIPGGWTGDEACLRRGIMIERDDSGAVTASVPRRDSRREAVPFDAVARLARRRAVLLRPSPGAVLVKHHTVPTVPRRELEPLLRYELERVTPFQADAVFWRWDGRARVGNTVRTDVTLTMVPKTAFASVLAMLKEVGVSADAVVAGSAARPRLIPIGDSEDRARGRALVRGLALACVCLSVAGLAVPPVLREVALYQTESAITALQPMVGEEADFRRAVLAADARRDMLMREAERSGDALHRLEILTRLLPDDTFVTELSLDAGRVVLSGRSGSAARLVTALSAGPGIRDVAFTAPVTRAEGMRFDIFSIKAGLGEP